MIIDSHQHFWNYNEKRDTWINESMGVLKKDFLPQDLEPILKQNKIDGSIAVQADQLLYRPTCSRSACKLSLAKCQLSTASPQ